MPGWDCHGLPIEWKIEEGYRERGQDKDSVPVVEFRRECREFAEKWVGVQTEEFKRLGVEGDWKRPYTTMTFGAEAQIAREIGKFLINGGLYRGSKPVLWSVVEKTALADAEVEYHMHTSTTIWVRFPVIETSQALLEGASVVIWTTTPWTIPGNRAVAFDAGADYLAVDVTGLGEDSGARVGETLVVAKELLERVLSDLNIAGHRIAAEFKGAELAGTRCAHPLRAAQIAADGAAGGYDFEVPLLAAGFVTMDQGTGFVHIAPGHGADDYELGLKHGLAMPATVDGDGRFTAEAPGFTGKTVYTGEGKHGDANPAVIGALEASGALLASGRLKHEYPHSWRSKAPLIFRNTPQWFISMETNELRKKALAAIEATRFVPAAGKVRLRSMIEQRPDWCVSRQRAWGVPIPVFVHKRSGEPLRDQKVIDRVAEAFEAEGADAWYLSDPQRFLGNDYSAEDYEQGSDIIEVWFESGSTHAFVLEARPELAWPASLYLGRIGPAPRLVPFLAAGILRHPRVGALRGGAHPRLHARREGPHHVQVPGHRHVAPGHRFRKRRRRHPALGRRLGLHHRSALRSRYPAPPDRRLPPPAQHPALPARQPGRVRRGRTAGRSGDARPRALGPAPAARDRRGGAQGLRRLRLPQHLSGAA